jgi:hypothetical protein
VNLMRGLGENVPMVKMVEKILCSLPSRFDPKVTIVDEIKDSELLGVDDLVGSLITYEWRIFHSEGKNLALKLSKKEKEVIVEEFSDEESFDSKPTTILTRNFHKHVKHAKMSSRPSSELPFKGEFHNDSKSKTFKDKKDKNYHGP